MVPDAAPATYTRKDLCKLLGRSEAALDRDLAAGRVPPGFRIGRSRKWLRAETEEWLRAGAPPAAEWEAAKKGARR